MNPPPAAPALLPAALADGGALPERLATMTHDLLAAADADRRLVWTNPAWQPTLGWSPQELAAASYHSLVHPEDLPRVQAAERAVLAGRAGERPETELRLRARDGSHRWFVFSTSHSPADALVFFSGKDITERKLVEEQLRAADERYRAITGATTDGIVSADGGGRIIFFNRAAEEIFGRPAADALGRPLTELMPVRYRDAHRAGIARFIATGETRVMGTTIELEGLRADGTEFPLELSLGSWSQSGAVCFTAVVRDVSDRVRQRSALREAEDRFAGAFDGAAVGMLIAAPDGAVLRVNRALCELTGRSAPELAGRPLQELLHPHDRDADAQALAAMVDGRTQRHAAERRVLAAGGGTRVARINLSLIRDVAGEPLHFVGQIEDVTERRRMVEALTLSEARYKGLVSHLPDSAVFLIDPDLRIVLAEGDKLVEAGYDPAQVEGRPLREVMGDEAYARLGPHYIAALEGTPRSFDMRSAATGAMYWVQIAPLRDEMGRVIGAMAVARDVTARYEAERILQERARDLERSNAELEQFAYVASHDLSEPLRMVSSYLQLLRRRYHGTLDRDADAFIDYAVDGAARMRDLIDDLLTYSRAGRGERPHGRVETGQIVTRVLDALVAHEDARTIEVKLGELPAVHGDEQQIGQLFQNLIGNAVKFVPEDRTARVRIGAVREGAMLRFTVADNGIGIDPAQADRIFRMFQRLHSRDEYEGTGIGLAIAKKVVERHGGSIRTESGPDGGALFSFTLPAAEESPWSA